MPIQPTQDSAIQALRAPLCPFRKPLRVQLATPQRFATPIKIVFVARSPQPLRPAPSSPLSPLLPQGPAPLSRPGSSCRKGTHRASHRPRHASATSPLSSARV